MPLRTSKTSISTRVRHQVPFKTGKKPGNFFSLKSWRINRGAFLRAHWLTSVYQLSAISCIPHFGESLGRAYAARLNCSPHDEALHLVSEQAHDEANSLSLRYQLSNKKTQTISAYIYIYIYIIYIYIYSYTQPTGETIKRQKLTSDLINLVLQLYAVNMV